MKIYFGFSRPKKMIFPIFSWLIRFFQKTPYSHVYVRWHSMGADVDVCYEASGNEVKFICKDVFDQRVNPTHEYAIEITREQYKKLLRFCMSNAGKKYGVKQVLGILLVTLFKLRKNPFSDGRSSWVCSELAGKALEDVLDKDTGLDLDIAGPKEIDKFLQDLTCAKRINLL